MKKAYINYISSYIPTNIITNNYLESIGNLTSDKILEKVGIKERYIANVDEYSSDMAIKAYSILTKKINFDFKLVDTIILCTQSPDFLIPGPEYLIHKALDLNNSCKVISINSGCSGFLYGLNIAKSYINSNDSNYLLFFTSETYSKHIDSSDISNRSIFGDAATVTLISNKKISKNNNFKINNFQFYSDGNGFDKIHNPNSGMHSIYSENKKFQMIGSDVYLFTITKVIESINLFLNNNKVTIDEIDFFVFHQASKVVLDSLKKKLDIPDYKFLKYIENVGNTVSSTIPILLENLVLTNSLYRNKKILLCGFGVGLSVGITIIN